MQNPKKNDYITQFALLILWVNAEIDYIPHSTRAENIMADRHWEHLKLLQIQVKKLKWMWGESP
jgi:hypothetical protein